MVYGAAFCPINEAKLLLEIGCADSKELNEETRDSIFQKICYNKRNIGWTVDIISPNTICNSMYRRSKCSLNEVSMNSAIGMIKAAIAAKVRIAHVYVDTVGKPEKYQAYLKSIFPDLEITVAKKADSTYPIVSAASICAKVTRDHCLKVWRFPEGLDVTSSDFGSGYPGDPVTKKFLVNHFDPVFGYPRLVRFSWSTAEKAMDEHAYGVEYEDIEEPSSKKPANNSSITSFFKVNPTKATQKTRHEYFKQRFLTSTKEF